MPRVADPAEAIRTGFVAAGAAGALHVLDIADGGEVGLDADRSVVMASVFKALVALEFYAQAEAGALNPAALVEVVPNLITPGPVGLSNFEDPVRVSLRDLAQLMMTLSDNTATDILTNAVGLAAVQARAEASGCVATVLESDLRMMLDGVGRDMGFASYADLLVAQSGRLGPQARARGTDPTLLRSLAALDPARASRTTARDMTNFLRAVWTDTAADPEACRRLREVMARQVTRRLEAAAPAGAGLAAKSGGLFGRVRNEIGVITYPDGAAYAFAVFTHANEAFVGTAAINAEMAKSVDMAIHHLRRSQDPEALGDELA